MNDEKASSSPPPHAFKEHEVAEYERKRYRGIDQRLVHRRETRLLERILERIAREEGIALDVPCGYGRFSGLCRKRGWHLISCDYSLPMVKRVRRRGGGESSLMDWGVVADAKKGLPFRDEAFSILLCMRFWHHVHDAEERRAILGFFSRVTSGWVILSYYQINALHRLQRALRRKVKKSPTRIKMIAKEDFFEEVRQVGFECVSVFPLFRGIHAQHVALLKKVRT